jgi:hypothetical protein
MTRTPRRIAAAAALVVALAAGTASAAVAAKPAPATPAPPAVSKVAAQVLLQLTPVARTAVRSDHTATVTVKAPANAVVTGTYSLVEGGAVIASGTLVRGTASVTLDLAPGAHRITAVYSGAAKVNGASTKEVVVAVPAA